MKDKSVAWRKNDFFEIPIHPAFADKSEGGLGLGFILLHLRALDLHQKHAVHFENAAKIAKTG